MNLSLIKKKCRVVGKGNGVSRLREGNKVVSRKGIRELKGL